MRKFVMGCAVVGLIALSPKSEARLSGSLGQLPLQAVPRGTPEVGVASWYGEELQGNETASGEVYDLNDLTAAHLTLPFGTTIRVTNLENGKHVKLRINDRGPHMGQRLLDVSWAAAKRLGFVHSGTTPVRVEVVSYPKSITSPCAVKTAY